MTPPLWQKAKRSWRASWWKWKSRVAYNSFKKLGSWHLVPSLHCKWMGRQWQTLFLGALESLQMVTAAMKLKDTCSLEEKLDSILKNRDITLPTKVHLIKAMVFSIVLYGCESLTIKKAEHWRIDAFAAWYWRRFLRVPGTARWSNQSILKKINPKYSLEGLILKLKLQYFSHLIRRTDSFEKTLMLGKNGGRRKGW